MSDRLIDWEQLDMIADGFTPDFVEIYREFEADLPRILRELAAALLAGDANLAARTAHQAKGSAANFGFLAFSALMAHIESQAKIGALSGLAPEFAKVEGLLQESFAAVRRERGI